MVYIGIFHRQTVSCLISPPKYYECKPGGCTEPNQIYQRREVRQISIEIISCAADEDNEREGGAEHRHPNGLSLQEQTEREKQVCDDDPR